MPLWTKKDGNIKLYKYLFKYRKYNEFNTDKLLKNQYVSLKNILTHAYNQTVYYRSLFDKYDVDVFNYDDIDVIKKLPILTKEIIWGNQTKLIAKNIIIGRDLLLTIVLNLST